MNEKPENGGCFGEMIILSNVVGGLVLTVAYICGYSIFMWMPNWLALGLAAAVLIVIIRSIILSERDKPTDEIYLTGIAWGEGENGDVYNRVIAERLANGWQVEWIDRYTVRLSRKEKK